MVIFKKLKIQSNFNKAASNYSRLAVLQKIVAKDLVELCDKYIQKANSIIDLGSGTGFVTRNILSNPKYHQKKITQLDIAKEMLLNSYSLSNYEEQESSLQCPDGRYYQSSWDKESGLDKFTYYNKGVVADIELLPFKPEIFDLAISSLAFQWLNDLNGALAEISSILKSKSVLAFSIIADESLKELREACLKCQVNLSINSFIKEEELKEILSKKFTDFEIKSAIITLEYNDVINLLKSIKSIGAGYSFNRSNLTAKDLKKINSFYLKNFNSDNKVFCTWKIIYAICIINK